MKSWLRRRGFDSRMVLTTCLCHFSIVLNQPGVSGIAKEIKILITPRMPRAAMNYHTVFDCLSWTLNTQPVIIMTANATTEPNTVI